MDSLLVAYSEPVCDYLSKAKSLSCPRNQFKIHLNFVTWCVILLEAAIRGCGHKGIKCTETISPTELGGWIHAFMKFTQISILFYCSEKTLHTTV